MTEYFLCTECGGSMTSAINNICSDCRLKDEQIHTIPFLKFFAYDHLPERLQSVSKPFYDLAQALIVGVTDNEERSMALRKLLEAKDCAVRARLG